MSGVDDPADLSYDLEDDGRLVRRQLDRRIWTGGGWATAIYRFEELDPATETWRPARAAIVRFRKLHGGWKRHAAINLSAAIAHELGPTLAAWFAEADGDDRDAE